MAVYLRKGDYVMKKRLKIVFGAVLLLVVVVMASFRYYAFVSDMIYTESVSHLSEIYHQSNRSLQNFVEKNWAGMHMWADYLKDVSDETQVEKFIEHAKDENGFTDFYFVCREGNYRTVSGEKGYLDLKDELPELILHEKDTVVNSVVPGKPQIMLFLTPAVGTYQGFAYEAVAISFNNSDMVKALKISAFDNTASSYMIHTDGRVILDNAVNKQQDIYNFLAMLKKYSDLGSEEISRIQNELKQGISGATVLKIDRTGYYLVYEPAEFEDWALVGLVPASVVNASMSKLQYSTMLLAVGVMIALALTVIIWIVMQNRQKLKKKDTEIVYRDELYSK